jgi:hypothetical protein
MGEKKKSGLLFMKVFDVALHERDNDCHNKQKYCDRNSGLIDNRIEIYHNFLRICSRDTAIYEDSIKAITLSVNSASFCAVKIESKNVEAMLIQSPIKNSTSAAKRSLSIYSQV